MKERRTQYEIYWEILTFCRSPRAFTNIISRCDLNSKIGQEYIEFLSAKGYLSKVNDGGRALFMTTELANDYIILFARIYQELFNKGPEFRI